MSNGRTQGADCARLYAVADVRTRLAAVWHFVHTAPLTYLWLLALLITTVIQNVAGRHLHSVLIDQSTNLHHLATDPFEVLIASLLWIDGKDLTPYLVLFTLIFFLHGGRNIWAFVTRIFPPTVRTRVADAGSSGFHSLIGYVRATFLVALVDATGIGAGLAIMGVPLAIVWAIFSFLTNYIPNIGFVIGLIPPALVALFANGWQTAVLVIVMYSVLNFVIQSIIQPRFAGESVGVTPTVSFVSLLLWAAVLGGMGTLLALPMTLLVKSLVIDADPRARWVNALIASDPKDAEIPEEDQAGDDD